MEQQTLALARLNQDSVLAALSGHIGKGKGVSIGNLVKEATGIAPCAASERRCREVVVELRRLGHHVCSLPGQGYYMARTAADLEECCRYLYERAMTSLTQVAAMKRVSLPDLHNQLHINLD